MRMLMRKEDRGRGRKIREKKYGVTKRKVEKRSRGREERLKERRQEKRRWKEKIP